MSGITFINNAVNYIASPGQEEWTSSSGGFDWIVPRGVYAIHACVIGGGGGGGAHASAPSAGGNGGSLAWGNGIPVTPGEKLYINVGGGGGNGLTSGTSGGAGGESWIERNGTRLISAAGGAGGGSGAGVASTSSSTPLYSGTSSVYDLVDASYGYGGTSYVSTAASTERCSGGGGAGSYQTVATRGNMNSGVGGPNTGGQAGDLGGGGGGTGAISNSVGGAGGGTGPWGQGSSGTSTATGGWCGSGGSGGLPASTNVNVQQVLRLNAWAPAGHSANGGLFGGGGAGGTAGNPGVYSGFGARGCVRIIWGTGRGYPSTNTGDYHNGVAATNSQQNYFTPGTYTWTVPAGVREFSVCAIGGGGGGMQGTTTTGKGSGAGGALVWANFPCRPGETYTVVAGDAGQSTALNTATSGGTSSVTRNASFKGFISGTNLFVTEMISGVIQVVGMTITGAGVTTTNINVFQTGEYGFEGTYTVDVSQTVGSLASPITFSGSLLLLEARGGEAARAAGGGTPVGGTTYCHGSAKSQGQMAGGNGGPSSTSTTAQGAGGGGAGGYNGTSGGNGPNAGAAQNGGWPNPYGGANLSNLTGGSCGGSTGKATRAMGGGGGGTGIYGHDRDPNIDVGQGPTLTNSAGLAGSNGQNGSVVASTGQGGQFGGGGAGAGNNYTSGFSNGGIGGVRITWGARHKYPAPTTDV